MKTLLLAIALALTAPAARADYGPASGLEGAVSSVFASNQEATNFSAHAAWSLAVPLAGHAAFDKKGALVLGGAWVAYSLANEAFHPPESARERNLNLVGRLVPCALVMLWEAFR